MTEKIVWETVGVTEINFHVSRGKLILQICADLFSVIRETAHPQHKDHQQHSKDALRSILTILSEDTIFVLAMEHKWKKDEAKRAECFLWEYMIDQVEELVAIVYRQTSESWSIASWQKTSCILAWVFDFEVEVKEHLENMMLEKQHQLPKE